ncbi:MFS transporter [Microbacterium sp. VKM Ac-2923]|uniref:MFS transporter n=1 Tax=Microbacterium sp. VKM Ac-2923 TaxID=2929476 RepID=UPI001FB3CF33|nr:MFS transporter [Microbacterium sp. VKM Ac-2923]MCJ1708552.1 MFS transporter [Microbacterium sp. VKM Ac-2923]
MTGPAWRAALSTQAALSQASWVGVRLMVGYRALELGGDPLLLAALAASFAVPTIVAALPAGRICDRVGGSTVAFAGLLIASAGAVVVLALPSTVLLLFAATLTIGLGHLFVMIGQQTFVAHASRGGSMDSGFGTLSAAASIGQLIGPPAVTIAATLAARDEPDTTAGFAVCLAFTVLALPLILFLRRGDTHRRTTAAKAPRVPLSAVMKAPELWRALAVSGAVLVTVDLLYTFVPLWAVEKGIAPVTVGLLLALRAIVSVVSRLGLARIVARFGRRTLLVVAMLLGVASLVALPFANQWGAIPVMIALGIALGLPQPLTMAWTTAITPPAVHGAALGLRLTANRVLQVLIPVSVGLVAGPLGLVAIFWSNAAVLAVGVAIVATSRTSDRDGEGLE